MSMGTSNDVWRGHASFAYKPLPSPSYSCQSPANWNHKLYSPPSSSPSPSPLSPLHIHTVPSPSGTSTPSPRTPSRSFQPQFPIANVSNPIPPTPTVTLPLNNANCVAILEGMLGKEHTLCLQVRSLSATIAKLTKDVLATGSACPDAFVVILKDQVAKLQSLMAMLAVIEENKRAFPSSFVNEVTVQWNQRFAKQKASSSRKRKGMESKFTCKGTEKQDVKLPDEVPPQPPAKQRKMFVVIPDGCKTQSLKLESGNSPKELMSINNIIN